MDLDKCKTIHVDDLDIQTHFFDSSTFTNQNAFDKLVDYQHEIIRQYTELFNFCVTLRDWETTNCQMLSFINAFEKQYPELCFYYHGHKVNSYLETKLRQLSIDTLRRIKSKNIN